jgi:meso-butanediol dehydrogenase / (S,S)-butanediol dehydrogenase / diacetyl reductase
MTRMRFEGRRVVVTGASRGIGRGIVDAFLEEGATVLATDVLADGLEAMAAGHPHGERLGTHVADLAVADQARGVVEAAIDRLAGVDVVVNNAGLQPDGPALEVGDDEFDLTFRVNVRAPMLTMQAACRHWIERGAPGAIVNVASANAFRNESPESIYNASKAALVALTNAFAHEMGHHGIRANCVAPGETITPEAEAEMSADPGERELVRRYLSRIPLRRAGVPRDQAMAVLFLASDDAAFVSAQTLIVDGGELGGGAWYDENDAPPLPPPDRPVTG